MGMCTNKQINDRMHDMRKGRQGNPKESQGMIKARRGRSAKNGVAAQAKTRDLRDAFAFSLGFYNS